MGINEEIMETRSGPWGHNLYLHKLSCLQNSFLKLQCVFQVIRVFQATTLTRCSSSFGRDQLELGFCLNRRWSFGCNVCVRRELNKLTATVETIRRIGKAKPFPFYVCLTQRVSNISTLRRNPRRFNRRAGCVLISSAFEPVRTHHFTPAKLHLPNKMQPEDIYIRT